MHRAPEPAADPSVLHMAAPLVVSFVMRAAFTFVDTIYAATIGDEAVAAIGLVVPLEFMMIALWVGLSTGLTSVLSRAMSAREGTRIQQYLRAAWITVWVISPLFGLVGVALWFFAPHMGLEADVEQAFRIYGTTLIVGSALTTFWSVIPDSVVKAHQDTRATMWAGICSNVINVALNTLFLFVFHWGVFGIALSTVLGRIGGLVYAIVQARRHERRRLEADRDHAGTVDPKPFRAIYALAVPSSMTFLLMATETALVNRFLAGLPRATEAIAAYSIFYRVLLFTLNPIIAGSVALLPYTARRFGRGDLAGIRSGLRQVSLAVLGYTVVLVTPVMLLGAPWMARMLAETRVSAGFTEFALRLVPLACLFGAPFLLCRPVFEGMQRGRPGLVIALVRYLILTAPLAWAGMRLGMEYGLPGVEGLVVGLLVASALSSAIFLAWLRLALRDPITPAVARPEGGLRPAGQD